MKDGKNYSLCVFLVVMTNLNVASTIVNELSAKCVFSCFTLILCNSFIEAGQYIGCFKVEPVETF